MPRLLHCAGACLCVQDDDDDEDEEDIELMPIKARASDGGHRTACERGRSDGGENESSSSR